MCICVSVYVYEHVYLCLCAYLYVLQGALPKLYNREHCSYQHMSVFQYCKVTYLDINHSYHTLPVYGKRTAFHFSVCFH